MRVDDHLPGCLEDGRGSLSLPVGVVKGTVHLGEPAVALLNRLVRMFVHEAVPSSSLA